VQAVQRGLVLTRQACGVNKTTGGVGVRRPFGLG
jgi:hypothetical protein